MISLTADEVVQWNDTNAQRWKKIMQAHPEALRVECDIWGGSTVADLLQHVVAAELRYAERLAGLEVTKIEDVKKDSAEEIFASHDRAMRILSKLVREDAYAWEKEIQFDTRSAGALIATRKTVLFHLLLHSMRHYAQMATLLRHAGIKADWPQGDYLFMGVRSAKSVYT